MLPVSVIIPTYNRSQFLPRALDSVLRQSIPCGEIIVVDDGSEDDTKEIVNRVTADHLPVKYIYQENSGPASARNTGIRNSSFPFLAFLDSDDHWLRNKLRLQYDAMQENPQYLISHTKERWYRRGKHLNQKKRHIPRHGDIFTHCLELCAVGMSTVMAKRELFEKEGGFDASMRCCEDYDYWLRISYKYQFLLVDTPLTVKEGGREDQVSYQYRIGMDKLRIYAIRKLIGNGGLAAWQRNAALREVIRKARIYGGGCQRHGKNTEAESYLNLAEKMEMQLMEK